MKRLEDPVTEVEISEVMDLLSHSYKTGHLHLAVRRLAFERDRLKSELEALRKEKSDVRDS